jgi:hypothetical protein
MWARYEPQNGSGNPPRRMAPIVVKFDARLTRGIGIVAAIAFKKYRLKYHPLV